VMQIKSHIELFCQQESICKLELYRFCYYADSIKHSKSIKMRKYI
jgi:hypothetical protein